MKGRVRFIGGGPPAIRPRKQLDSALTGNRYWSAKDAIPLLQEVQRPKLGNARERNDSGSLPRHKRRLSCSALPANICFRANAEKKINRHRRVTRGSLAYLYPEADRFMSRSFLSFETTVEVSAAPSAVLTGKNSSTS